MLRLGNNKYTLLIIMWLMITFVLGMNIHNFVVAQGFCALENS